MHQFAAHVVSAVFAILLTRYVASFSEWFAMVHIWKLIAPLCLPILALVQGEFLIDRTFLFSVYLFDISILKEVF